MQRVKNLSVFLDLFLKELFFKKNASLPRAGWVIGFAVFATGAAAQDKAALEEMQTRGEPLYQARCAQCHDHPEDYIPPRRQLELRSADYVINALTRGSMYPHAEGLEEADIAGIAVYVTGKLPTGETIDPNWKLNACGEKPRVLTAADLHWNGWGRDVHNSRYQPAPGFSAEEITKLTLKWVFAYPNGRHNSQPTLVGEQVIVAAAPGRVYSLDAGSGCTHWVYDPDAGVRATVVVGPIPGSSPARYAAYIGTTDRFLHAVDAQTGEGLWKTQLGELEEARVTAAPIVFEDKVIVPLSSFEETAAVNPNYVCCRFRGNVLALDAKTGDILWRTYAIDAEPKQHKLNKLGKPMLGPAGAAIWSSPTIDPKRRWVFVATGDSYTDVKEDGSDAVIALDIDSGEIQWKNQVTENDNFLVGCFGRGGHANCPENIGPDYDFGSSVILREAGDKTLVLAGQKSGIIYAMDVGAGGEIVWRKKLGAGSPLGGIQWGSAADDNVVYVPVTDMLAPPSQRRPGLTALEIATGKELWHTPAPAAACGDRGGQCNNGLSAAISVVPGAVFAGSLDGILRAYSTADGGILWEFDTKQTYISVNGLSVRGGSINATGPTVANGKLFINSGYGGIMNVSGRGGGNQGQDGNVLLVFGVE